MKKTIFKIVVTALLVSLSAGCTAVSPKNQAGASSSNPKAGSWDTGLRNNENPSMGAKSVNQSPQPTILQPTIDNVKAHVNTHLKLNRDLADQIIQAAHLGSTAVAITDNNIYVAVDMGGMQAMGADDGVKMLSKHNDPENEAGLFGSGVGSQMDWLSAKPLPAESANAIRHLLTRIYPETNIFISSNPHFVNRMMYYDTQQRNNKRMDTYLNEFNTMVQYVFPTYSSGQRNVLP
ncbi:YhcN/YlaJ family sporulation lipoprotein [Paenibacillus andongensis]|uniref:YhcN/YlaJ family sporulation lipoprotein n=1 Tax=Paenibacillus andongensis TaxID=2975482 RepID=UPI0021BAE6E3|nr:YhcN/YlaJ family sporulation lipoprotein [Paenibacillus andongensis]